MRLMLALVSMAFLSFAASTARSDCEDWGDDCSIHNTDGDENEAKGAELAYHMLKQVRL